MDQYIIVNNYKKYFVKINELNKMVFTNIKEEATKVSEEDAEELISLMEDSGHIVKSEIVR